MKKFNLVFILILVVALGSCTKKQAAKTGTTALKPKVKVALVVSQNVPQNSEFTATVEPEVKNNIAPSAPGRIRKILVEVGARVSKGQKLAQMDNVNLSNTEVQIDNYRRILKRVSGLFAVGGASQQELDNAKLQLDMAETNLKNLSENTFLISPINGIVTARNYDEGDMYSGQMPIMTVMQITPVKLKINVTESYYSKVKNGMPVNVTLDVYENETFSGKISLIYPTIDDRTRTFGVEIKVNNANSKIRPGMFARVKINFGTENRVLAPDMAVVKQSGSAERYVYVVANGKALYRKVEIGQRIGANYELLSGLISGQTVVVSGQSKLNDGMEVEVLR